MILKVTPKRAGQIVIEKVQWELLDQFRCEMPFQAQEGSKVPKQLLLKDKMFHLRVLPESAELCATIKMKNDLQNIVYSETDEGVLTVRNNSATHSIKNIFLICSHPVLFGLKCLPVAPDKILAPDEEITMPIDFRAALVGHVNVRFVIRYEVEGLPEDAPPACKFRVSRMILFLNSNLAFKVAPFVNMSVKESNTYIINFQTW